MSVDSLVLVTGVMLSVVLFLDEKAHCCEQQKITMKPTVKWPLDMSVMERLSWRFQSAVVIGLVGLSSKIFLGRCTGFQTSCLTLSEFLIL